MPKGLDAALDLVDAIGERFTKMVSNLASLITAPMQAVTNVIVGAIDRIVAPFSALTAGIERALAPLAQVLAPLNAAVDGVGSIVGSIVSPFSKIVEGVKAAVQPLNNLVGKLNPAMVTLVTYAIDDLQATIGYALQPVLQAVLPLIQQLGDFIANLDIASVAGALAEVLGALGEAAFGVMNSLRPLINLLLVGLAGTLHLLIPVVEGVAWVIDKLVDALLWFWNVLADLVQKVTEWTPGVKAIDLHVAKGEGPGDKTRAVAASSISFGGLEEAMRKANMAAGKQGIAPEERTAENTAAIRDMLGRGIVTWESDSIAKIVERVKRQQAAEVQP